jgi:CHASE3 domain sensor protein
VGPIALAAAGVFGLFYAAYDTWRELRDKQYHSYHVLGKILLEGTPKESDKVWTRAELNQLSRKELNQAIESYLQANAEKLDKINQELFGKQYELSFANNRLVLNTRATTGNEPNSDKPLSEKIKNSLLAVWTGLWNLLAMYSMVYWIVFMSAMIAGKLVLFSGSLALAFSPFIAFAVPAMVALGCLAPMFVGNLYHYFVPNDKLIAEKSARIQLLKAFWLRKKYAKTAKNELDSYLDKDQAAAILAKKIEIKLPELPNIEQQALTGMDTILQGKKRDIGIRTAINAIKVYVVGVFILWPFTDMLSFFNVAVPGLTIITFVLPLIFAAIYAGYCYHKEKQAFADRGNDLIACQNRIEEISKLTAEAKQLKTSIRENRQKLLGASEASEHSEANADKQILLLKMPVMPQHDQDDLLKQMEPKFETWNKVDKAVDTSRNIIGSAGTGAFIVRSFMLMSPIVLIINPQSSLAYMIATGVACAAVAAIWIGVSLWEYQHNKQRKLAATYLQEIGLRKEALRQEVKVLQRYQAVLEKQFENAPNPVHNAAAYKGVLHASVPVPDEQQHGLSSSPSMHNHVSSRNNPDSNS